MDPARTDLHHLLLRFAVRDREPASVKTPKPSGAGRTWGGAFLPPAEEENIMDYVHVRRAHNGILLSAWVSGRADSWIRRFVESWSRGLVSLQAFLDFSVVLSCLSSVAGVSRAGAPAASAWNMPAL